MLKLKLPEEDLKKPHSDAIQSSGDTARAYEDFVTRLEARLRTGFASDLAFPEVEPKITNGHLINIVFHAWENSSKYKDLQPGKASLPVEKSPDDSDTTLLTYRHVPYVISRNKQGEFILIAETKGNLAVPITQSILRERQKSKAKKKGGTYKKVEDSFRLDSPQIERYVTFTPKPPYGLPAMLREQKAAEQINGKFIQSKLYGPIRLSSSISGAIFLKVKLDESRENIELTAASITAKSPYLSIFIQQGDKFFLYGRKNQTRWELNPIYPSRLFLPDIKEGQSFLLSKFNPPLGQDILALIRESNEHLEEKMSAFTQKGGDLANFVIHNDKLTAKQLFFALLGIAYGIREIHNKKLVHRDLTPENIILLGDSKAEFLIPQISDLDQCIAEGKGQDETLTTAGYASPEVLRLAATLPTDNNHRQYHFHKHADLNQVSLGIYRSSGLIRNNEFLTLYPGARRENDVWAFSIIMNNMIARFIDRTGLLPSETKAIKSLVSLIIKIMHAIIPNRLNIHQTIGVLQDIVNTLPYRAKIHAKLREIADDPDRITQYQQELRKYAALIQIEKNTMWQRVKPNACDKLNKSKAITLYIENLEALKAKEPGKFTPFSTVEWDALTRSRDRLFRDHVKTDVNLFYEIEALQLKATAPTAHPTAAH